MPYLKTYDLFISHAWKYGEDYERLIALLNSALFFHFRNYSAPPDKPLQNLGSTDVITKNQIQEAIERKIKPVNAFLIISGMYYNYREWMQYELECAVRHNKPIIAIEPRGILVDCTKEIRAHATEIVGWSSTSIIDAVRKHAL